MRQAGTFEDVWNAACTVSEPATRRRQYELAVLVTSSSSRLWMVRLAHSEWLHAYPRLIVGEWEDARAAADRADDAIVGMRWGNASAHKALAGALCFGQAFRGRYRWLLIVDDDTVPDQMALAHLVGETLRDWASPHTPWLFGFVPQPWPRKAKFSARWVGCMGNVTSPCMHPPCRTPDDITKPCLGDPVSLESSTPNLGLIWPYGGTGMLLSAAAVEALSSGQHGAANQSALTRPEEGYARGAPTASMGAWDRPHARTCLAELTCPWGIDVPCSSLPPALVANEKRAGDGGRQYKLCPSPDRHVVKDDCRRCGMTDVQIACCLGLAGVFTTDLSALDGRQDPRIAHWSPWAAHLKLFRDNRTSFERVLQRTLHCGLGRGPVAWLRSSGLKGDARASC